MLCQRKDTEVIYRARFIKGQAKQEYNSGRLNEQGAGMISASRQNKFRIFSDKFVFSQRGVDKRVFGEKVGFIGKFFGCWHEEMSRPFSHEKVAYRSCLKCGARKQFNAETLETFGEFYFPPMVEVGNFI